jgi:hypothetical protein
MTLVWQIELPASEKLVLLALADCANDEGGCWPSMATLSTKCSKGERTVQTAIQSLVKSGHLTRDERPGRGCFYTVHPRKNGTPAKPAPPQKTAATPAKSAGHPRKSRTQTVIEPSGTVKPTEARAHEIPDGWQPMGFGETSKCRKIIDEWPPDELETQIEHFIAHHRTRGNKFKDWQDVWKTWVIGSRRFGGTDRGSAARPARQRDSRDGFERALDRRIEARHAPGRPSSGSDDEPGLLTIAAAPPLRR